MTLYGQAHIDAYLASDGEQGYIWRNGTTILLLTTVGRRSGQPRTHALIYREHNGDYLVVASKGGADDPPDWYLNLQAQPVVQVQIKGDRFTAHARSATPDEKPELWRLMVEVWPDYAAYQKKTEREIPVVVLERA